MPKIQLAQEKRADALLSKNPLALLIGMVLDQQITIEMAFRGPLLLSERIGRMPTAQELADFDPDKLKEIFSQKPALHRFPGSMAKRTQDLCDVIIEDFGGKPDNIWKKATTGEELLKNVKSLPGFGDQKAKIFVALLGKQLNVQPPGWDKVSAPFSKKDCRLSVADITDEHSLAEVRAGKKLKKQAAKNA